MRDRAKLDPSFRERFLHYISEIVDECMPPSSDSSSMETADDSCTEPLGSRVFHPFIDPHEPNFDESMARDLADIVSSQQMHSPMHMPTCYKYGSKKCRARFPRKIIRATTVDPMTGLLRVRRNHPWVNKYNRWISIITTANHDCQILLT